MNQRVTMVVVVAVVLSMVAAPIGSVAAADQRVDRDAQAYEQVETENATATDSDNETEEGDEDAEADGEDDDADENETDDNASVTPGEQLNGVIGVQEAEVTGEVEDRAFGLKVARAASDGAAAKAVGEHVENANKSIAEYEQRIDELKAQREAGEITRGEYRSEVAVLEAKKANAERALNHSENVSEQLPRETLEANGVNVDAIKQLRDKAQNLSGTETAEIARSIAGRSAGEHPGAGRPAATPGSAANGGNGAAPPYAGGNDNAGGPDSTDNETDDADNETDDADSETATSKEPGSSAGAGNAPQAGDDADDDDSTTSTSTSTSTTES